MNKKIDLSNVPWASLSPEQREIIKAKRRRVRSRVAVWGAVLLFVLLVVIAVSERFGAGLSLLSGSVYVMYYATQMKRLGVALVREGWTDAITKRKNPVLFRIEVLGCYLFAVWLFGAGVYLLGQAL